MNPNFNFTNYMTPPTMPSFSPLAWLDPRLNVDHELSSKTTPKIDLNQQPSAQTSMNNVHSAHTQAGGDVYGISAPSAPPAGPGILVTPEQFSSHFFLMAHSQQYMGLLQAYMEVNSQLRALNNGGRASSHLSRSNSLAQSRPDQKPTIKKATLPTTTTLPKLNKADYPNPAVMWTKKEWNDSVKTRKNHSTKVSAYDFLRDEDSSLPSGETIGEMRDAFKEGCCRLELVGLRPQKWRKCVPEALKYIRDIMCAVSPLFRYANNDWKVRKFGSRVYPDWSRNYEDSDSDNISLKKRKTRHPGSDSDSDSDSNSDKIKRKAKPIKKRVKVLAVTKANEAGIDVKKSQSSTTVTQPSPAPPSVLTPTTANSAPPQPTTSTQPPPAPSPMTANLTPPKTTSGPPSVLDTLQSDTATTTDLIRPNAAAIDPILPDSITGSDSTGADNARLNAMGSSTHGLVGLRRPPARSAKANKKTNPLLGLEIPKPTDEVPHSETAPEMRTRGGAKVMEPHPTHLSAKNMFAHEMKKKNPDITQDEFNTLYDKLGDDEKKAYDKLGKARKAELKKEKKTE